MENLQIYRASKNSFNGVWKSKAVLYARNEVKASLICDFWLESYKAQGYRYEIEGSISDGSYYVVLYKNNNLAGSLEINIINVL